MTPDTTFDSTAILEYFAVAHKCNLNFMLT